MVYLNMILKDGDTHIPLDRMFHHFTIDFEGMEEMTEQEKSNAWGPAWVVVAGGFNLFG